jgi:hypothetical protein
VVKKLKVIWYAQDTAILKHKISGELTVASRLPADVFLT